MTLGNERLKETIWLSRCLIDEERLETQRVYIVLITSLIRSGADKVVLVRSTKYPL